MTAGELALKALSDTTRYDALELGHGITEDIEKQLYTSVQIHKPRIDADEFCVVYIIAKDNLIPNLMRRKFYCWPFLPKPRPNQAVFLYNRQADAIVKRLWVLPCAETMSELASLCVVHDRYKTMQAWSVAFFEGKFWEYIRYESNINMLSESEHISQQRQKAVDMGINQKNFFSRQRADFGEIKTEKIIDTLKSRSVEFAK